MLPHVCSVEFFRTRIKMSASRQIVPNPEAEAASGPLRKSELERSLTANRQNLAIQGHFSFSFVSSRFSQMKRFPPSIRCLVFGLLLTIAQIAIAVCLLAPEEPFSDRYASLVQHDGYWFANIVDRGYATTVPPIDHKVMEVSNVAFFPAYPVAASLVRYIFHLSTTNALLVTAQAAAWGFWSYFFLFCKRWNLSPVLQFFGALSIAAHPAAFFLVAGYSESLFLMALLGFIYWSSAEGGRLTFFLAALHGVVMSATRIVGIPCAAFPVVRTICQNGWTGWRDPRDWIRRYAPAVGLMFAAMLGAGVFLLYCLLRWGRWDMYMLTQSVGWGIEPDYLAIFKPQNYRWLVPELDDPTEASQMAMSLGALMFVVVAICELLPAIRRRTAWTTRIGIYFCAAIVFYVSVSGVASVQMESMLRYQFCAHALIVLALLHFLHQFRILPVVVRAFGMAMTSLIIAAGFGVQGWYVWNFTRACWVA